MKEWHRAWGWLVIAGMTLVALTFALTWKEMKGPDPEFDKAEVYDPDGWGQMGFRLVAGKGLIDGRGKLTAFRGPVAPLAYAAVAAVFGPRYEPLFVAQCVMFALAAGAIGLVCQKLWGDWRVTLVTMVMYVGFLPAWPWFLNIFTEPLFTLMLAVFVLAWLWALDGKGEREASGFGIRGSGFRVQSSGGEISGEPETLVAGNAKPRTPWFRWTLAGIALALTALCRPVMYFFVPVVLLHALWRFGRTRRTAAVCAALLAGFMLLETPWIVRNYLVLGRFVPTTSGSAQALYLAAWHEQANWMGNVFHDPERFPPAAEGFWSRPEEEREAWFRQAAWEKLRNEPLQVLLLVPKRAMMFLFQMRPTGWLPTAKSLLVGGVVYALFFCGLYFAGRERRRRYLPCLLLIAFHFAFHSVLQGEYRYSHPIQPYIFMPAALAVVAVARRLGLRPDA